MKTSVAILGFIFYLALGLNAINAAPKAPSDYLVTSLPGYVGSFPSFKIYSGYITVDEAHGRELFFLFAESQNNPSTDPVILWLQGGPGCSGLIGLTSENGFLIPNGNPNGGMQPNGWSWNRFANMLYIESPAGVGFSYSHNKSDYTTGDNQTAADNYTFLKRFFSIFTAYRNNDFYVSGESYGGVYGPTLVYNIVTGDDQNLRNQLKGFMLGNPVIDCSEYGIIVHGMPLQVQLYFWHAMVSYNDFHAFDVAGCNQLNPPNPSKCQEIFNGMNVGNRGENTDDNLYYNHCTGNGTLDVFETVPNCITFEDIQTSWLNRVDVQKAIHARHVAWSGCSSSINYITSNPSMLGYVKDIVASKPGLKILFYSGDVDIATVPHAYTQFCLAQLKRPIVKKWRPYYLPNNIEVAGYVEAYDQFTFATIKGAGHEAPQYQPAKAYHIISNFVKSGSIP